MGVGRIASFLSSLSPASDPGAATASVEPVAGHDHVAEHASAYHDRERRQQQDGAGIAQQLATMISAVRVLNESAVQEGAAVAVSSTGNQLMHAVSGLGHLLAAHDANRLVKEAESQLREANVVLDGVEAGLAATQQHAQQLFGQMPAQQAAAAREASERFQAEMRDSVNRVRGMLGAALR